MGGKIRKILLAGSLMTLLGATPVRAIENTQRDLHSQDRSEISRVYDNVLAHNYDSYSIALDSTLSLADYSG